MKQQAPPVLFNTPSPYQLHPLESEQPQRQQILAPAPPKPSVNLELTDLTGPGPYVPAQKSLGKPIPAVQKSLNPARDPRVKIQTSQESKMLFMPKVEDT
jgi:hypothetical protein